ncbi:hypothetical protein PENTCL1PPCAC_17350, partial [Pristionchus entomophagus]
CQSCAQNLITITTNGNGAHAMESDVTNIATCATRTFTCIGTLANIEGGQGTIMDADDGAVDGVATFTVTCNTAGTAWVNTGIDITQVECASKCLTCPSNLISITTASTGGHAMDGDVIDETTGPCLKRTFTCEGKGANIEINGDHGVITDESDVASFTLTCNEDGTAWMYNGVAITQVECAPLPACKMCEQNLIMKTTNGNGAKPFAMDTTDTSGTCAVRTLTCVGNQANIEEWINRSFFQLNNGDGTTDPPLVVTCNAGGTAWLFMGIPITQAECAV